MSTKPKTFRQQRICTEVNIDGVTYPSMRAAGLALGMPENKVRNRCLSKRRRFAQWQIVRPTPEKIDPTPVPVVIGGVKYASITAASRLLKIARTVVLYRCTHNLTVNGVTYDMFEDIGE